MNTEIFYTESRRAENALRESEQKYKRLLASVTDYIYSVKVERGQPVATSHGPGCEAVTGYTPAEFEADPLLWYRMVHEKDRPAVLAQASRVMRGERALPLEHRIIHKDGSVRWIRNTPVPHRDSEGTLMGYDGSVTDITEVKQSDARFRGLLESAPDAMVITNAENKIVLVNSQTEKLFGYARQELLGNCIDKLIPARFRNRHAVMRNDYMACPHTRPMGAGLELFGCRKDGTEFPADVSLSPLETEQGTIVAAAIRDVTRQKQAENLLKESEERFRQLAENINEVFWMTNPAKDRMIYVSPAYEGIWGRGCESLYAQPRNWLDAIHPEDRSRVFQAALEKQNRGEYDEEYRIVRPDGSIRWIHDRAFPVRDESGTVYRIVGIARDISEGKQAEEQHRQDEARLQAIVDNSPLVIHLKDTQGRYILINRCFEEVFRVKRAEVMGKSPCDLFPREAADALLNHDQMVMDALTPLVFEETLPQEDGLHTYLSSKFPLLDSSGAAYALCAIAADITQRRRAEEQLKQANAELTRNQEALKRALHELGISHENLKATQLELVRAAKLESVGTLAAGVAHEVKNPLQTILLGVDYLDDRLRAESAPVRGVLADMRDAVLRARMIVGELLQLSASNPLAKESANLNSAIERSLRLVHSDIVASRITVVRNLDAVLPRVSISPGKIEQVFINLFLNAVQAMPGGGILTVTTRAGIAGDILKRTRTSFPCEGPDEIVVIIEVQDTGPGIADADLPRIFDPFFTTKPVGVGTGLGLPVVKTIVGHHDGAIDIRNVPQGGVLVTLILKAVPEELAETKNEIAEATGGNDSARTPAMTEAIYESRKKADINRG